MNPKDTNERLMRLLQASPEQLEKIDRVLTGNAEATPAPPRGPLLMQIKDAAELLGVHRATIWRLVKARRLETVPLLGAVRVRRADIEGLAAGHRGQGQQAARPRVKGCKGAGRSEGQEQPKEEK